MKHFLLSMMIVCGLFSSAMAGVIQETIEAAVKISGKSMSRASRQAAVASLKKLASKYGDDALKMVRHGGVEALHLGEKYGDDFLRLAKNASPRAIRSVTLHADELLPIARKLGKDFMMLEGKVPGLGAKVVAEFGDDTAVMLARNASAGDISKLLGLAVHADSPATRKLLVETYKTGGSKFLEKISWKHIAATGLSAATITAAYKISNGVENGLEIVADKHPETFKDSFVTLAAPFAWGITAILLAIPAAWIAKRCLRICREKRGKDAEKKSDGTEEKAAASAAEA